MKTSVIIGSRGQDGTLLGRLLSDKGHRLIGYHRTGREGWPESGSFDLVSELEQLFKKERVDEVFYLAAFHHASGDRLQQPAELIERSYAVNTLLFASVLDLVRLYSPRTRVFYAGSSHMYGPVKSLTPLKESAPYQPITPYALSKVAATQVARYYRQQHDVFATVGVLFNHESYLRSPRFLTRKVIDHALLLAEGRPAGELQVARPEAMVDWGYAPEYMEAVYRLMEIDSAGEFNIGSGQAHTVEEFVRLVFLKLGLEYDRHVEVTGALNSESYVYIADTSKIEEATGWSYSRTLEQLVDVLIETIAGNGSSVDRLSSYWS